LLQAPFRAGIRLDGSSYQLLPLRKALRLPRINLLIADDVGLGKTIEAALIVREMLLRRRLDLILMPAPPTMTTQWKDELEAKFGLTFEIMDRDRLGDIRRLRGFTVNPWATGSRFIISHRLLVDETYVAACAMRSATSAPARSSSSTRRTMQRLRPGFATPSQVSSRKQCGRLPSSLPIVYF
jgi:hypothetical protein